MATSLTSSLQKLSDKSFSGFVCLKKKKSDRPTSQKVSFEEHTASYQQAVQ
jgi:hypothetical protein